MLVNSTGVGTLGRTAQILELAENTIVDSHVTVVRADDTKISWNYLGLDLGRREEEIEALGEGSTGQTELGRARLGNLPLIVPVREVLVAFDKLSLPSRQRIAASENESRCLAAMRDTLLPKLVSGEIRVKDAERLVAEHI